MKRFENGTSMEIYFELEKLPLHVTADSRARYIGFLLCMIHVFLNKEGCLFKMDLWWHSPYCFFGSCVDFLERVLPITLITLCTD